MSPTPRIDLVAPPYAGHLFPLLDLAGGLRDRGFTNLRVLTTADAAPAVRLCGLTPVSLLPGREQQVRAIVNTAEPVGSNPLRLLDQFRANVSLMGELADQLRAEWTADRPDLVIADYTVPLAGLTAQRLGIRWWTSTPSPCTVETRTGTPSYLGGWMPPHGLVGRMRDAAGRQVVRLFKRTLAALLRKELRAVGVRGVYRPDGTEVMYSPDLILGFGMTELEFDRDWPAAMRFVGPLTASPPFPHDPPEFPPGKPCVLVTLGTHLPWARGQAAELIRQVAERMPECVFHFAQGEPGSTAHAAAGNLHTYGFVPYARYLPRYAAAVTHAGTGVMYECIKAGVPALVWPQDYDHHDYAARVVHRGLGLPLRPRAELVAEDLRRLMSEGQFRERLTEFQRLAAGYDPHGWVADELTREFGRHPRTP